MPFCTQCGKSAGERDLYCGVCGAPQPASSGPRRSTSDWLDNLNPRTAALLCYIPIVGWIPAIVVLASGRFHADRETRFHAFQGLYLFVAWLLVDWVVKPVVRVSGFAFTFFPLVGVLKAALFAAWIWMIVKVSQNESCKLPFLGDLAEKSVAEQR
ncbi:MAG: hypothetical protein HY235_02430 [Acidobacteria bacterium]|nr:hypothetical protein [Acidobacteriota bacterium]